MSLPALRRATVALSCVASILLALSDCFADEAVPSDPAPQWWRGNIHTHSLWSDGDDFPEMIAEWYRTNSYNFLALSDHNVMGQGMRWMKLSSIESRGGKQVLEKYKARFGEHWIETKGEPDSPDYAIRLKPLNEFRSLVEQRGKFIMIQGEEISDSAEGVPVHMNATNLSELIEPLSGATVREAMSNNLRAVEEQAKRAGREILLHLNHPNFGYAITAEDIAAVVQERFFEVYNGHPAVGHHGDDDHPGVERLWDIANTIRLGELNAEPLFGVATDDSHNYHGKPNGSTTGRGWVMVRSHFLTPEQLLRAMKAGDFYASSGVALQDIVVDKSAKTLKVKVNAVPGETYTTQFIGTLKSADRAPQEPQQKPNAESANASEEKKSKRPTKKYSAEVGAVLAEVVGTEATYQMTGNELFVRAVVTSSALVANPPFEGQLMQAWTQPVVPTAE